MWRKRCSICASSFSELHLEGVVFDHNDHFLKRATEKDSTNDQERTKRWKSKGKMRLASQLTGESDSHASLVTKWEGKAEGEFSSIGGGFFFSLQKSVNSDL